MSLRTKGIGSSTLSKLNKKLNIGLGYSNCWEYLLDSIIISHVIIELIL